MSLPSAKIQFIEEVAENLVIDSFGSLNDVALPINLNKILEKRNLKVLFGTFPDPNIAGAYNPEDRTIYVTAGDSFPRQLFTIAHEIGHDVLHGDEKRILLRQQISSPDDPTFNKEKEQEANWFAASLLMPKELLIRYWNLNSDQQFLTSLFGVSNSALEWRLKNLGLKDGN